MGKRISIVEGQRFNRWTVIREVEEKHGLRIFLCKCDCGSISEVYMNSLRYNRSKSCGCLRAEMCTERLKSHGMSNTTEYNCYCHMIQRCNNKKSKFYRHYGGRGIVLCDRWSDKENGFINFIEDMGMRPDDKQSIDRIDVNKGYSPDNCRWADYTTQAYNKRNTVLLSYNGKNMNMQDWSSELNIPVTLIRRRHDQGLEPVEIFCKPFRGLALYEYNGESKTLKDWSEKLNIKHSVLYKRIHLRNWSIDRAFSTPPRKTINNKYVY